MERSINFNSIVKLVLLGTVDTIGRCVRAIALLLIARGLSYPTWNVLSISHNRLFSNPLKLVMGGQSLGTDPHYAQISRRIHKNRLLDKIDLIKIMRIKIKKSDYRLSSHIRSFLQSKKK